MGDFNDYIEKWNESTSSLPGLVNWNQVKNVVDRLNIDERRTHFYKSKKEYKQLDYIPVSKTLKSKGKSVEIERRGIPKRADKYTGPRFVGVGKDNPKASDHCPVIVELNI